MHEVLNSFKQYPSQKLHKTLSKTQNLDLNAWNAWRMRDKEIIPSDLRQEKAENHVCWRF